MLNIDVIKQIKFSILSDETVQKISNVGVVKASLYVNGKPADGGAFDLHLGSTDYEMRCLTCNQTKKGCLGHSGHFNLKYPHIKPMFFNYLKKLLKIICVHCSSLQCTNSLAEALKNDSNRDTEYIIQRITDARKNSNCIVCKQPIPVIIKNTEKDLFLYYLDKHGVKTILYTHLLNKALSNIKQHDLDILNIPQENHPKNIITSSFYVPSNKIRPDLRISSSDKTVNDLISSHIQTIIRYNDNITPVTDDTTTIDSENIEKIKTVNMHVMALLIAGNIVLSNGNKIVHSSNFKPILERLKGKEGLIRKNILGRRVHGMFRGVIVCDPTLPLDHIRIPIHFAKKLTIEETVTDLNKTMLTKIVKNRTEYYPGATYVKKQNGRKYSLLYANDLILEEGDIVYRNLIDGDIIYFNRQPSLTYTSICAVKIVVESDPNFYAIGMNVLICKYFAADFDGDQMNGIILNSVISRNESYTLGGIAEFIMSKQFSNIHLGQSYDSIIGCFLTTRDSVSLNKKNTSRILSNVKEVTSEYLNIFNEHFKKQDTISGRALASIPIPKKISLDCKTEWYNPSYDGIYQYVDNEKYVKIVNGELISGVLDKATIGEGGISNSIYNLIYTEYGKYKTIDSIFDMQQIALNYTMLKGFSLNIKDVMVGYDNIKEIKENILNNVLDKMNAIRNNVITGGVNFKVPVGITKLKHFETKYVEAGIMKYINIGKYVHPEHNNLLQLAMSGSKGKLNQIYEMIATIGIKLIDGVNLIPNNKFDYFRTSPYYQRFDLSPEAKGFISNSYFSGTNISEYLVMTMSGRHDIIVKALLTANAGDQNRKSIKNLESVRVNNLRLIINNTHIIQYTYGSASTDCAKSAKLNMRDILMMDREKFIKQFKHDSTKLLAMKDIICNSSVQYSYINILSNVVDDVFKFSVPFNVTLLLKNNNRGKPDSEENINKMSNTVSEFCDNLHYLYFNENVKNNYTAALPDMYKTSMFIIEFVIRIHFSREYLIKHNIHNSDIHSILQYIEISIIKSFIQPGTPIGILTAQCISEPMIQNALDTHRGAAMEGKRKSGMKRIKEILSAKKGDKINDLTMNIILKGNGKYDKELNEQIALKITMLKLKEVISCIEIFYEDPLVVSHPDYLHDQQFIDTFLKYNKGHFKGKQMSKFNIRLIVDKMLMFNKKTTLNTIIHKIKQEVKGGYVIYTNENAPVIVIRIYIPESYIDKKSKLSLTSMQKKLYSVIDINITGIPNILSAKVVEASNKFKYVNGDMIEDNYYFITTLGVNTYDIFLIPEVDNDYVQMDDITSYATIYGIEAVKDKICYELKDLIDDKINFKHYLLAADAMTRHGILTSFEKQGLDRREKDNVLLRLGFSHARSVIEEAAIKNKICSTEGLTPSLMVGSTTSAFGTNFNDLYIDIDNLKKLMDSVKDDPF